MWKQGSVGLGGGRGAVTPEEKGKCVTSPLSHSPSVALPHFQIQIKVSSAALLKVCPTNTEVGREGSVGGVVFPQNFLRIELCYLFLHSYFIERLQSVRMLKMSSVLISGKDA